MYMNNVFSPPSQLQQVEMRKAFIQQYGNRPHMSPLPNPNSSQSSLHFSPLYPLDLDEDEFELLFFQPSKETTSHDTSDSAHIGLDLNDEATDSEDEEVHETRPIGQYMAKKMGSSSASGSTSSVLLVDALLSKFTQFATSLFSSRKESSTEYLRIKER
nr:hypothetical protein [Tanacetum cinerariifolium]